MSKIDSIRDSIKSLDYSIRVLEKEKSKLEKKLLEEASDSSEDYLTKFEYNYDRFMKGVPDSVMKNSEKNTIHNTYSNIELGRLGEEEFNTYIRTILDMEFCEVTWMNEEEESNKPFDFMIKIGRATFYIDVKTTRGKWKTKLNITKSEMKFARSRKPNYFVARLSHWDTKKKFRAGDFNVTILDFDQAVTLSKLP